MQDSGEVLQGLSAKWTFLGATAMEWGCGIVMFFIVSLFGDTPVRLMPLMLAALVLTTLTMASLRKSFPDEERGVRNAFMTACGFAPTDIPTPAALQPDWSSAPLRSLPPDSKFVEFGFEQLFLVPEDYLFSEQEDYL